MSIDNRTAATGDPDSTADSPSAPRRGSTAIALIGLLLLTVLIAANMNC
ncbi:MAG: hypothetical protein JNJ46_11850 [Myxococcales bacterium]|nr:hypothetical protein [Myxococcales bacterium]